MCFFLFKDVSHYGLFIEGFNLNIPLIANQPSILKLCKFERPFYIQELFHFKVTMLKTYILTLLITLLCAICSVPLAAQVVEAPIEWMIGGNTGIPRSIKASPDGKYIATENRPVNDVFSNVHIWDTYTNKLVKVIPKVVPGNLTFISNSELLVWQLNTDGNGIEYEIGFYNIDQNHFTVITRPLSPLAVGGCELSADRKYLIVRDYQRTNIVNTMTDEIVVSTYGNCFFTPDSKYYIHSLFNDDNYVLEKVMIEDSSSRRELLRGKNDSDRPQPISFLSNSEELLCSTKDAIVILNLTTKTITQRFSKETSAGYSSYCLSKDKKKLAITVNNTISIWDIPSGFLVNELVTTTNILGISFLSDNQRVVVAAGKKYQVWNLMTESFEQNIGEFLWPVTANWQTDGTFTVYHNGTVSIRDSRTKKTLHSLEIDYILSHGLYDLKGDIAMYLKDDSLIVIQNVKSKQVYTTLVEPDTLGVDKMVVSACLISSDKFAVSYVHKDIEIRDLYSGKVLKTIPGTKQNHSLQSSPDGRFLLGQFLGTMSFVWELQTLDEHIVREISDRGSVFSFEPNTILSPVSGVGLLKYDIWSRSVYDTLPFPDDFRYRVFNVGYSFDKKYFYGLTNEPHKSRILFWDTKTGKLVATYVLPRTNLASVSLSPDNSSLLAGTDFGVLFMLGPITLPTSVAYQPAVFKTDAAVAFPNPASSSVTFEFHTAHTGNVAMDIFDITGVLLKSIIHTAVDGGLQTLQLETSGLGRGTYYAKVSVGGSLQVIKFVVL